MANSCWFGMEVIASSREDIDALYKSMADNPYENVYDPKRYVPGVEDINLTEIKKGEHGLYIAQFNGTCRNSLSDSVMTFSQGSERNAVSIQDESKRLGLSIELFSEETGNGFQEHICVINGDLIIDDSINLEVISFDADSEHLEEFFEENIDYGYTMDDLEDLVDDNGDIVLGGFEDFMVFHTKKNADTLFTALPIKDGKLSLDEEIKKAEKHKKSVIYEKDIEDCFTI